MTHYEYIKSMEVEELAEYLTKHIHEIVNKLYLKEFPALDTRVYSSVFKEWLLKETNNDR